MSASIALADPALKNDSKRARELLLDGADVTHGYNTAVQNAARGAHEDVLKLAIVADEFILAARDDARRHTIMRGHQHIDEMLERIDPAIAPRHRVLQHSFTVAVKTGDKQKASLLLDQMIALVFPPQP